MSATIRKCRRDELTAILAIVNAAAEAYRGVIPADRWHEPYMTRRELESEIAAGVVFWGYQADGALIGVMGIQPVGDLELIRHAYVLPGRQRRGVGGALLEHLASRSERRMLVGTWAAAGWAIDFYRRHGFALASPERGTALLKRYWTIPDRQVDTSVVLARPPLDEGGGGGQAASSSQFANRRRAAGWSSSARRSTSAMNAAPSSSPKVSASERW